MHPNTTLCVHIRLIISHNRVNYDVFIHLSLKHIYIINTDFGTDLCINSLNQSCLYILTVNAKKHFLLYKSKIPCHTICMEYTFWFLKSFLTVPFPFFMQIYFQFKVVWRSWGRWPFVGHFYHHTFPSPAEWACSCVASVCLKGKKRCIELFISPLSIDKIF